ATTVPLSTSTTCKLALELAATRPFISELMRSASVAPDAASAATAGALRARDLLLRRLAAPAMGLSRIKRSANTTNRVDRTVIECVEPFSNVAFICTPRAVKLQFTISDTAPATPAGSDRAIPPDSAGESHHESGFENTAG